VGGHDLNDWQERYETSLHEDERRRGVVEEGFWENPAIKYMLTSGAFFLVTFAVGFVVEGLWWVVASVLVLAAGVGGAVFIGRRRASSGEGRDRASDGR
jgi:Flp pilus assembly protein TadB